MNCETSHETRPHSDVPCNVPRVGVGVLLVDAQDRVLLTLRKRSPEAGCWSIVGGKVDFLENLEQCAVREAREEAGVDVELIRLLCVTDHVLPNEGQHWVAPAYLGRIVNGEPRNCEPDKTQEVNWFALGSVPENLTMTAQNAIAAYLASGGGGFSPLRPLASIKEL
jgi:8-oxo-dGTP diphosphatase